MTDSPKKKKEELSGIFISLLLHVFGAAGSLLFFGNVHARSNMEPTVFTVTLEGGQKLGGMSQVPKQGKEAEKPPLDSEPEQEVEKKSKKVEETTKEEKPPEKTKVEPTEAPKEEKPLEKTSLVEELEKKKLEADLKKKEEEKKIVEEKKLEEKKKKEEEKLKEDQNKKKLKEELEKKAEAEKQKEKLAKEKEKKDRDRRLSELAKEIKSKQYEGESVNAGGEGFGAARLGGQAGGGGTLAPYAKVAYQNELQQHVKSGWRWMSRATRLRTLVRVKIQPSGEVSDVRVEQSSGNSNFDDSVVRAVRKASPVPPPPKEFYNDFSDVRFWFDSEDQ